MDELERLFAYNRWSTLRLLDAAEVLAPHELTRDLKSSFPSVLATFVHMLGAERIWLERWKGTSPAGFPDASGLDSVRALRDRWDVLWQEQQRLLEGLGESGRTRPLSFKTFKGDPDRQPLGELMRHAVNHGTYHRGQVVTMLRQLGRTPPATDYVRWLREQG